MVKNFTRKGATIYDLTRNGNNLIITTGKKDWSDKIFKPIQIISADKAIDLLQKESGIST